MVRAEPPTCKSVVRRLNLRLFPRKSRAISEPPRGHTVVEESGHMHAHLARSPKWEAVATQLGKAIGGLLLLRSCCCGRTTADAPTPCKWPYGIRYFVMPSNPRKHAARAVLYYNLRECAEHAGENVLDGESSVAAALPAAGCAACRDGAAKGSVHAAHGGAAPFVSLGAELASHLERHNWCNTTSALNDTATRITRGTRHAAAHAPHASCGMCVHCHSGCARVLVCAQSRSAFTRDGSGECIRLSRRRR